MTTDQLRDTYTGRISNFQNSTRHHNRLMNYLALLRLIMLVVLVWLIILGVKQHQSLFYLGSGLAAAGFLFLVSRYNRQKDLRTLNIRLRELNELEISCLDHQFHSRPDGMEYADSSHPWSHDLDLFGKGSLYQFLNRTSTLKGSELLAGMLTTEPGNMETIDNRQGIIADLKDKTDFRQTFTARGTMVDENSDDLPGISRWLSASAYIVRSRWLYYMAMASSGIALGIIIYGLIDPVGFKYMLPLLLFNFALLSPFMARTNQYQQTFSKVDAVFHLWKYGSSFNGRILYRFNLLLVSCHFRCIPERTTAPG